MFTRNTFSCNTIFQLHIDANSASPFNLTFVPTPFENGITCFQGPGVYILSHFNQVIYIGSFKSTNASDIRSIRWARHLETISLRGRRVGFGRKSYNRIADRFPASFREIFSDVLLANRLIDTGVVTSINRISYALDQWQMFSNFDNASLEDFSFEYFKFIEPNIDNQQRVRLIEKSLINMVNPKCNYQHNSTNDILSFAETCQYAIQLFENT